LTKRGDGRLQVPTLLGHLTKVGDLEGAELAGDNGLAVDEGGLVRFTTLLPLVSMIENSPSVGVEPAVATIGVDRLADRRAERRVGLGEGRPCEHVARGRVDDRELVRAGGQPSTGRR